MEKSFSLPSHRQTVLRQDNSYGFSENGLKDEVIHSTGDKTVASLGMYPFVFALPPMLPHSFPFTTVSLG